MAAVQLAGAVPVVVLGLKSYEDILRDQHARTVLTTLRADRTLVFVGCGAGLRTRATLSAPARGRAHYWPR